MDDRHSRTSTIHRSPDHAGGDRFRRAVRISALRFEGRHKQPCRGVCCVRPALAADLAAADVLRQPSVWFDGTRDRSRQARAARVAANISASRGSSDPSRSPAPGQQIRRAPAIHCSCSNRGWRAGVIDVPVVKVRRRSSGRPASGRWLLALRMEGALASHAGSAVLLLCRCPVRVERDPLFTVGPGCALMLQDGLLSATGTRPEIGRTVSAGLLAGAGALVRPAMLLFLPIAAVWLFATSRHRLAIAFVLAGLLPIVPWTFRNIRVYDRFVLIIRRWCDVLDGNHPLAVGDGDLARIRNQGRPGSQAHAGLSQRWALSLSRRLRITACVVDDLWLARRSLAVPYGRPVRYSTRYRTASAVRICSATFAIAGPAPRSRACPRLFLAGSAVHSVPHLFPRAIQVRD